jgi:hypothetical protein
MLKTVLAAGTVLGVVTLATGAAYAEYGNMRTVRGWQVGPYFDDSTGDIYSCDAIYDYGNALFRFEINVNGITVSMTADGWNLSDNSNVPITLRVGRYSGNYRGSTTANDDFVWVDVGWDDLFWEQIKRAVSMEFIGRNESWEVGLIGSRAAAEALESCIDTYFDTSGGDPFN